MNQHESGRALMKVIGQSALLVSGSLLVLAASTLFVGLMLADQPGPMLAIIALLNAAMFYLMGLGSIRYVHTTWKAAEARLRSDTSGTPPEA